MFARLIGSKFSLAAYAAVGLVALPTAARAVDVKVENYANETVHVALAYYHYQGSVAAEGWYAIKTNASHTFKAADKADMYLRVEKGGKEVKFNGFDKFRDWPVEKNELDRFTITKVSDDGNLQTLAWGGNPAKHKFNIEKGGKLPVNWDYRRFFRAGTENLKLEVRP